MDKPTRVVVGTNVNKYRIEQRLKKIDLCRKIGWKNSTQLTNIERGKVKITLDTLDNLAKALDVKVIDLIEGWEE